MDIPANVFNEDWLIVTGVILTWLLMQAIRKTPWTYVLEHTHVYLEVIVFASFIWILRAGIGNQYST